MSGSFPAASRQGCWAGMAPEVADVVVHRCDGTGGGGFPVVVQAIRIIGGVISSGRIQVENIYRSALSTNRQHMRAALRTRLGFQCPAGSGEPLGEVTAEAGCGASSAWGNTSTYCPTPYRPAGFRGRKSRARIATPNAFPWWNRRARAAGSPRAIPM